jgi:hypothetical protein
MENESLTKNSTAPRVVKFAFKNFSVNKDRWSAKCKLCDKSLGDKVGVTSSFTKYV